MTTILPEVPVADAPPQTLAIYDAIMTATGVGSPALIYRHFAATPGLLPWVWAAIGDDLEGGAVLASTLAAIEQLPPVDLPSVSKSKLQDLGVDAAAHRTVDAILATYNRMNPVNLCFISAIRGLLAGRTFSSTKALDKIPKVTLQHSAAALPPPLGLHDVAPDTREMILSLSDAIPSDSGRVIPTLYRHFAIWPDLLLDVGGPLLAVMESGEIERSMQQITDVMEPIVDGVGYRASQRVSEAPPVDDTEALIATMDAFLYTIPQLIAVGRALRAALPVAD